MGPMWRKSRAGKARPDQAGDCGGIKLPRDKESRIGAVDAVWHRLRKRSAKSGWAESRAAKGGSNHDQPKTGGGKPVRTQDLASKVNPGCRRSSVGAEDSVQEWLCKNNGKPKCRGSSTEATGPMQAQLRKATRNPKSARSGTDGSDPSRERPGAAEAGSERPKPRGDRPEPMWRRSSANSDGPAQHKLCSGRGEPKMVQSMTGKLNAEPDLPSPRGGGAGPKRACDRISIGSPVLAKAGTGKAGSTRAKL